jgi:hypothetical protein
MSALLPDCAVPAPPIPLPARTEFALARAQSRHRVEIGAVYTQLRYRRF